MSGSLLGQGLSTRNFFSNIGLQNLTEWVATWTERHTEGGGGVKVGQPTLRKQVENLWDTFFFTL